MQLSKAYEMWKIYSFIVIRDEAREIDMNSLGCWAFIGLGLGWHNLGALAELLIASKINKEDTFHKAILSVPHGNEK